MAKTSQDFVPIDEIRDGVIILKNGELRLALMVSTTNFDLKNEDEQTAIILQYQNMLNSLDFSIQIYIQSRKFDIRPYISLLEDRLKEQTNDLLKIQTREYIDFIKNLTEMNNIMSKLFFVIIPYTPAALSTQKNAIAGLWGKKATVAEDKLHMFEENHSQLEQRRDVIIGGLARLGIKAQQLGTEELVELFYKIFNPGEQDAPTMQAEVLIPKT